MKDVLFDITKRDIVLTKDGSDLELTSNPSTQNGGILLLSRCASLTNPIPGIGVEQFMNGDLSNATFEMNRWKAQVFNDGATLAKWSGKITNGNFMVKTEQSYL